jgi:hypothetical protein
MPPSASTPANDYNSNINIPAIAARNSSGVSAGIAFDPHRESNAHLPVRTQIILFDCFIDCGYVEQTPRSFTAMISGANAAKDLPDKNAIVRLADHQD